MDKQQVGWKIKLLNPSVVSNKTQLVQSQWNLRHWSYWMTGIYVVSMYLALKLPVISMLPVVLAVGNVAEKPHPTPLYPLDMWKMSKIGWWIWWLLDLNVAQSCFTMTTMIFVVNFKMTTKFVEKPLLLNYVEKNMCSYKKEVLFKVKKLKLN